MPSHSRFRFDIFEVDCGRRELRRRGMKIELTGKPFTILKILVERAGEIVSREELRQHLWSSDTHVDFDANLSTALRNLRRALQDSHKDSKYIETIPGDGYRFHEPVFPLNGGEPDGEPAVPIPVRCTSEAESSVPSPPEPPTSEMPRIRLAIAAAMVIIPLLTYSYWHTSYHVRARSSPDTRLLVLPLVEAGVAVADDHFSTVLADEIITKMTRLYSPHFVVIAMTTSMHYKGTSRSVKEVAEELDVGYVLEGTIFRTNDRIRISVHLIQTSTQSSIWADDYDRSPGDLLVIQEDVADRIVQTIASKIVPSKTTLR
jgi:TolB-like protein/DNA-binding winged helix-turn-helix (wHTH) protein